MRVDELLGKLGIPWAGSEHRHGRHGWVQVDCPWCGPGSGKMHLGININSGGVACWRCGRHRLYDTLVHYLGSRQRASDWYGKLTFNFRVGDPVGDECGVLTIPKGAGPMLPVHRKYLWHERGISPAECERLWSMGGIGMASQLAWRLYFPVFLHRRQVSWTTRAIGKVGRSKYISAKDSESVLPIDSLLYGIDYCTTAALVHEGPMDVVSTGPGAVALFGLGYSESQLLQLSSIPRRGICLDNEPRAQDVAYRLADDLSVFPGETMVVKLETGKDMGEAEPAEVAEIRRVILGR